MNTTTRSLTLVLTLAVASLLGAVAAHAQTVITSLPYTITTAGNYVLNQNLNSTQTSGNLITVNASNVTIDFQGHYVSGPLNYSSNYYLYGIYASERSDLTIRNGTIAYCYNGIELTGNSNVTTTNNLNHTLDSLRVSHCVFGIELHDAPGSTVTNCKVTQIDGEGIIIDGPGTTVQGCVLSQTGEYGIVLDTGSFARQNSISNAYYGIINGKYQDNLTSGCTYPFADGIDAGGNN